MTEILNPQSPAPADPAPAPEIPAGANAAAPTAAADTPHRRPRHNTFTPKLVVGIGIIVAGLLMTLDNLIPDHDIFRTAFKLSPAILIVLGFLKLRSEREHSATGWFLVAGGAFGLLVMFGHRSFEHFIGPAILLAVGIFIVTRALKQHRGVPPELQASTAFLACSSIFSGCKRNPIGPFKGAELTAIFGGFEVDLRKAEPEQGTARVDVFVLFGGGEVRVPEGWEVQNQVTAIFGGVDDKSHPPVLGAERPRIVLTGLVLFGGIEIKT